MVNEAHNNAEQKSFFDSSVWDHVENLAAGVAEAVARALKCDEVQVVLSDGRAEAVNKRQSATFTLFRSQATPSAHEHLFSLTSAGIRYGDVAVAAPLTVNDLARARLPSDLAVVLSTLGVKSFGVFLLTRGPVPVGCVSCFYKKSFHRWRSDEIAAFGKLGELLPCASEQSDHNDARTVHSEGTVERYQRLATRGNLVILTADRNFTIKDVFGNTEGLLGISSEQLKGDPAIWSSVVDRRDAARFARRVVRLRDEQKQLQEEIRVVHQKTGETRWLLLRALPYHSESGELLGWEGFGVDVTERRDAQSALVRQNARLQALFEISRSLGELHDPAVTTLTGLRAVIGATRSECGYAVFCGQDSKSLEVVAAVGLSEEYLAGIDEILEGPSLLRRAIDARERFLIPDLQADPRAARRLAQLERIRATIVVPLIFENVVYGGIVLFKRTPNSYDPDDFELAVAAASQITLAVHQAELLEVQRRQSASLGSLYTVSRELAKYRSAVNFTEQILPTLQHEFALKRCWVGLLNSQGTFIVGRSGFGPDVTADTIATQIEVSDEQPILQDVLSTRVPMVFDKLEDESPEAIISLFQEPQSLVVVPMVTIGQTLGVLVLEPLSKQMFASAERLQLLVSMANEMATVIMADRFETKMAHAVKMRTAGLLASGVAHNFNNILQAILGQVSLVQLHAHGNSAIQQAGHTIQDAAMRGAALVRQLLNFSTKGSSKKHSLIVPDFLADSRPLYESLLGNGIRFSLDNQVGAGIAVHADQAQLQQVITGMLANAKDALGGAQNGEVDISVHSVVVRASELAAELTPGSYVRIDIRDNGSGMNTEQQARCFEPFFTTKNVDRDTGVGLSGAGLGLAAAYAIVKEHSGAITVHSKEGEGSIFSVYLPLEPTKNDGEDTQITGVLVRNAGVLLLGVDSGTQPFIASALESLGYDAQGVFDLRQAREQLAGHPERWRAILIDQDGCGLSWERLCEQLAADFPSVSRIVLGATPEPASGETAMHTGVNQHHLVKPVTGWALEAVMRGIGPRVD